MKKINQIILIDDDEQTNYLHKVVIRRADIAEKVLVFDNAGEALSFLLGGKKDKNGPPLVLVDINMPAMSGWDFVEQFEQSYKHTATVVILTSSINPNDQARAKSIPAVKAYRSKPLTEKVLKDLITEFY